MRATYSGEEAEAVAFRNYILSVKREPNICADDREWKRESTRVAMAACFCLGYVQSKQLHYQQVPKVPASRRSFKS